MKSKVISGRKFKGCLNYVLNKPGAELISTNLIGSTVDDFANQFNEISDLKQITKPVLHIPLSLPKGEKLSDEKWNEVIDSYFKKMDLDINKNQFVAVRHTDNDHDHIHLVINKVDYNLKVFKDPFSAKRSIKACQEIEKELNLTQTKAMINQHSNQNPVTNLKSGEVFEEKRTGLKSNKSILQDTLSENLKKSKDFYQFVFSTLEKNIKIHPNIASTGNVSGLSFEVNGVIFKGSQLGKNFTFGSIKKKLDYDDRYLPLLQELKNQNGFLKELDEKLGIDRNQKVVIPLDEKPQNPDLDKNISSPATAPMPKPEVKIKSVAECLAEVAEEKKIKDKLKKEKEEQDRIDLFNNEREEDYFSSRKKSLEENLTINKLIEIKNENKHILSFHQKAENNTVYWKTDTGSTILESDKAITLTRTDQLSMKDNIDFMIDRSRDKFKEHLFVNGKKDFVEQALKQIHEKSMLEGSKIFNEIEVDKKFKKLYDKYFTADGYPVTKDEPNGALRATTDNSFSTQLQSKLNHKNPPTPPQNEQEQSESAVSTRKLKF